MGTGPSQSSRGIQTAPNVHDETTRMPPALPPTRGQTQIRSNQGYLEWPLPPKDRRPPFELVKQHPNRYSLDAPPRIQTAAPTGQRNGSSSPAFKVRETDDRRPEPVADSQTADSAHVQSQLSVSSHACFNLASSGNVTVSMKTIQESYKDLDGRVKQRLDHISKDADAKLHLIIDDTEAEEKRLIEYDKRQQAIQGELYQKWLQKYVVELNKWRSEELADLQQELMNYQAIIIIKSQDKIKQLGDDANNFKFNVLQEEHARLTKKTNEIAGGLHNIAAQDSFQHLGSESKTEINLRVHANVGTMAPGQSCTNDPSWNEKS